LPVVICGCVSNVRQQLLSLSTALSSTSNGTASMGYVAALCMCNCMWMLLLCFQSSEGSESYISFGRGIHSLHCADVYFGIKLNVHEVQSVISALMMPRNLKVFYLKLAPLHSARECGCMVLSQKTTVEVMSFKGLTSFTLHM
jgi:hypothetical protein